MRYMFEFMLQRRWVRLGQAIGRNCFVCNFPSGKIRNYTFRICHLMHFGLKILFTVDLEGKITVNQAIILF